MLSKKTKYAIKALVKLAREYGKGPILIETIAEEESIPKKFLEIILLNLKNAGILGSRKGKGGGYYLVKNPKDVNMVEIHRLFEGPIALLPCVSAKYYEKCDECADEATCGIRMMAKQIHEKTLHILEKSTLYSIVQIENKLKV